MDVTAPQPFPVARFTHYGDFRFYYAYGNTPPEDFLDSVTEVKEPTILSLGCGDLRSCYYTLWKNFHPQHKCNFSGVHFVLNDYSAGVLARNILFLYLCIRMPTEMEGKKKWVAAMWSIWYCHELLPEHEHVLRDALNNLLKWSSDVDSWSNEPDNPLRNIVKFASLRSLREIHKAWKMWFHRTVNVKSVEEMRSARISEIRLMVRTDWNTVATIMVNMVFGHLQHDISQRRFEKSGEEFISYLQCGHCFAESVLNLPVSLSVTSVNLTLYERMDAQYTLHYESAPYKCFFQAFQFSSEQIRKNDISHSVLDHLIVEDKKHFTNHPLLANSVQQFAMWLSVSAGALKQCLAKASPNVSFTFQCSDALNFCQSLQHAPEAFTSRIGFDPMFDAIHSSNLCDHIAPPNLVLSAVPLLKENSNLFTTTFLYKEIDPAAEKYLEATFGFEAKLLPLLCGVRCIGHEGNYSNSISVQPITMDAFRAALKRGVKVLIWQHIVTLPLRITPLDKSLSLLKALSSAIVTVLTSYFDKLYGRRTISQLCTETVMHVVLSFVSQMDTEVDINNYQYWKPLCSLLCDQQKLRPFMASLQTQALLHGLHFHLIVSESDCPLCTGKPVSDYIGQFSVTLDSTQHVRTPTFAIFGHSVSCNIGVNYFNQPTLSSLGTNVHIIDSVAGSDNVTLHFYAPQVLASNNFHVTVCAYGVHVLSSAVVMKGKLADCKQPNMNYFFRKVKSVSSSNSLSNFGEVIQHFGDGDSFETIVSLSNDTMSALNKHKLDTKYISKSRMMVTCAEFSVRLCYPYAVDYNKMILRLSKKNRTVTVLALRRTCNVYEEKPMFTVMPDHILSLPPMSVSENLTSKYCSMAYTIKEKEILEQCNQKPALMPVEVNLKQTITSLFIDHFVCTQILKQDFQGMLVVIHNRVCDLQNMTPAIDLSFCTLDTFHNECPNWLTMVQDKLGTIIVDDAEYELLKKVFHYFAQRTFTTAHRHVPLLTKHKIDAYFTRAVVYPLYPDQDVDADSIINMFDLLKNESKTNPVFRSQQTPESKCATGKGENERKCSFCGTHSDALKKCSRCGKAQYCGQGCQEKHWKEHKKTCAESATHPNTHSQSPPISSAFTPQQMLKTDSTIKEAGTRVKCSYCGTHSDALKKCSRCGKAQYCGQGCQKKHWQQHRTTCTGSAKGATHPNTQPKNPPISSACSIEDATHPNTQLKSPPILSAFTPQQMLETDTTADEPRTKVKCSFCGIQSDALKKCSRCGKAQYCGQGCQKKHWKEHKMTCTGSTKGATHPNTQPKNPPISSACSIEDATYPNTHAHS